MSEEKKGLGDILKDILAGLDWKGIVYNLMKNTVIPELRKLAAQSGPKWDDKAVDGLEYLVELFLGPDKEETE